MSDPQVSTRNIASGRAYYFGCYSARDIGHFWFDERRQKLYGRGLNDFSPDGVPWGPEVDAHLKPGYEAGVAALHHRDGWTALAFEDRSADSRPNSNSVFALEGTFTFEEALAEARRRFPWVWERIDFEVVPHAA